jgi:hypothetical protein
MADKDQVRKEEESENLHQEPEVTELDDKGLEEASGGLGVGQEDDMSTNGNCVC